MTHWKKLTNPDYLGAYALDEGQDLIATIDTVKVERVTGSDGKSEDETVIHFKEKDIKPMILNKTNAKTISKIYKTPYIEKWHGKKIQLYSAQVKAFGEVVDALRIRERVPKEEVYVCADCGAVIEGYGNLSARMVAEKTLKKYGDYLCTEHATARKAALEAEQAKEDVLNDVS